MKKYDMSFIKHAPCELEIHKIKIMLRRCEEGT